MLLRYPSEPTAGEVPVAHVEGAQGGQGGLCGGAQVAYMLLLRLTSRLGAAREVLNVENSSTWAFRFMLASPMPPLAYGGQAKELSQLLPQMGAAMVVLHQASATIRNLPCPDLDSPPTDLGLPPYRVPSHVLQPNRTNRDASPCLPAAGRRGI